MATKLTAGTEAEFEPSVRDACPCLAISADPQQELTLPYSDIGTQSRAMAKGVTGVRWDRVRTVCMLRSCVTSLW